MVIFKLWRKIALFFSTLSKGNNACFHNPLMYNQKKTKTKKKKKKKKKKTLIVVLISGRL
jgi:hypothetical protein